MGDFFVFRTALRDAIRPKRLSIAVLLVLLPGVIGLLWRLFSPADRFDASEVYNTLAAQLIFGFTLTILAVIYGTGVLSQEIEGRTIVYLLTRPMPRWRILLAKFAGAWVAITVTVVLAETLLALAVFGGRPDWARLGVDLRILPLGALTYGALFLLLATFLNRPLMVGLLFAFGWESWVPSLPGGFSRLSIMSYLRVLAPHLKETADAQEGGGLGNLLLASTPAEIPVRDAWIAVPLVAIAALGLALYLFSVREYVPREDVG
jgi:ABC-2 type transport system permease protein